MIYIIGGSGFVGSFLIKELLKNHNITNLDKNESPYLDDITINGVVRNLDSLKINPKTKCVILLAAEHRDDVRPTSLYYDVNVQGTKNVLKAMDKAGVKNLIFTSSVAIYGLNKINPDENHPDDPFNHYGKSKWDAELAIRNWYDSAPLDKSVTILRPTVIFGEKNRGNVYNLFKQIASGKFVMIGKGNNKKSMAYVRNVVAFINNRIEINEMGYNVFNYADKPDFTMLELIRIIQYKLNLQSTKKRIPYWLGLMGGYFFDLLSFIIKKKLNISSVRVKKFCATTQFNSEKVQNIFIPPYSLENGINNTLEYEFLNSEKDDVLFYSE